MSRGGRPTGFLGWIHALQPHGLVVLKWPGDSGASGLLNSKTPFLVVIPFTAGQRIVRTSGVHLPIWPLESEILVRYAFFPIFSSSNDLINYLVDQVECGLLPDKK